MKRVIVALIALLLLASCGSDDQMEEQAPPIEEPEPIEEVPVQLELLPRNEGIFVKNIGEADAVETRIKYDLFWFGNIKDGPNERTSAYIKDYPIHINVGGEVNVAQLTDCIHGERLNKYNIYKCVISLLSTKDNSVMDQKTVFLSYDEQSIYLIDEGDFEAIREYIISITE